MGIEYFCLLWQDLKRLFGRFIYKIAPSNTLISSRSSSVANFCDLSTNVHMHPDHNQQAGNNQKKRAVNDSSRPVADGKHNIDCGPSRVKRRSGAEDKHNRTAQAVSAN